MEIEDTSHVYFFSKTKLLEVEFNNAEMLALKPLFVEKTNIFVLRGGGCK